MNAKRLLRTGAALLAFAALAVPAFASGGRPEGARMDVKVLATSDVHTHYLPYDFFTDKPDDTMSLVQVASIINEQRSQAENVLLFDDGDNIQGTPLGDYLAKNPPTAFAASPITTLLNAMRYDAVALGNHEFNYGLDYLSKVMTAREHPVLCANVVWPGTDDPVFTPYAILKRSFRGEDGRMHPVTFGVLGLLPPQIMTWDALNLTGKVETRDGAATARKYVPRMQAEGAEIIIILAHSGLDARPETGNMENYGYWLTEVPGVDVLISGHSHLKFPGAAYRGLPNTDMDKGTINGVAALMPSCFGDTLGVIDLHLTVKDGKWTKEDSRSSLLPVYDSAAKRPLYGADSGLAALLDGVNRGVLDYIRAPIGGEQGASLSAPLTSFFSVITDDYSVELINKAQEWYARAHLSGPDAALPLLSAAAPFKAGGRQGPSYYTNVPAGPLAVSCLADLYVYPNTITLVKVTGADVKEWLERAAGQFNQILPDTEGEQPLVNAAFPAYNFDVIDGVTYAIDVSRPSRYSLSGELTDASAERIIGLQYNGEPINPEQEFIIVTNNYRAGGGGHFPGIDASRIVFASPDENRQAILGYLEATKAVTPESNGNWKLLIPEGAIVTYRTGPDAQAFALPGVSYLRSEDGWAVFRVLP